MQDTAIKVRSIHKAVHILELMAAAGQPMALRDLSRISGYPKSTLYGLISSLRELGLVEQSSLDGRYRLGMHLFELGCSVCSGLDVTAVGRPYLQSLAERTGETAFLATQDRSDTIILEQVETSNPLRVAMTIGSRMPLTATSQGKVFLAYHEPLLRQALRGGLTAYTPHSIVDEGALLAECKTIRENGYAIENGEYRVGLRAVSAPIFGSTGEMQYTIGTVGMFRKIQSEEFTEATRLVTEAAKSISHTLGWRKEK